MEKFIYGEKNGTHILDLRKSLPLIENALKFALECSKNKKKFLFVSTKKQHGEIVENIAKDTGNFLPGHGGVLDRIDGILLGIPIGFLTLILIY